jgi:hypothetical protein
MSDVSVAVADAPSASGADWANRDNPNIYRRSGTPLRRPNAPSSVDEDPAGPEQSSWWGSEAAPAVPPVPVPVPEFGPVPSTNTSRASFGVSAGPIGGYRPGYGPSSAPASPAANSAPASPAANSAPVSPAPRSKPLVEPVTGHTGEIFDGPAREIRQHRALRRDTGSHPARQDPTPGGTPAAVSAPAKRSRGLTTIGALALGGVLLLGGAAGGVVYFSGDDNGLGSVLEVGVGKTDGRTATAPLAGRTAAGFEMVAASSRVTVKTQDLGDDLYKVTTADGSGMVPSPTVTADRVQMHLTPDGAGASGDVTVLLSAKVRWSLRFSGGSDEQLIDMTGGRVGAVDLIGGARRVELTLPKPTGTVPVRVTGGLDELTVRSPAGAPVRVNLPAGAKTVAAGTRTLRDVRPGSTLTPKDWQVKDRYDVDVTSWVTLLSVDAKG